jgi:hypothetical protein
MVGGREVAQRQGSVDVARSLGGSGHAISPARLRSLCPPGQLSLEVTVTPHPVLGGPGEAEHGVAESAIRDVQSAVLRASGLAEFRSDVCGQRFVAEGASVGVPVRNGLGEDPRGGRLGRRLVGGDPGGEIRLVGVRREPHVWAAAAGAEGDPEVEDRRSHADQHLPALRVEGTKLAAGVDENIHPRALDAEQPRLGVVDRRRGDGRQQALAQERIDALHH